MKVGDKVFIITRYNKFLTEIIRETKTQWIVEHENKYNKKSLSLVGSGIWDTNYIKKTSEEEINEFLRSIKKNKTVKQIKEFDLNKLSQESLDSILLILDNKDNQ